MAFYDFWLTAGANGVPIPVIDHATADLNLVRGVVSARVSGFMSRAKGIVELRPSFDQNGEIVNPFRDGRGRSWGIETQIALRGTAERASSVSLTYVLSQSSRSWHQGPWIPWAQDRRHLIRLLGQTMLGHHWTLFGAMEVLTGPPLTPIEQIVNVDRPGRSDDLPGSSRAYVHGDENSARGSGTARADVAVTYGFAGLWGTRMGLGISVLNVGFDPVAPILTCGIHGCGDGKVEASTPSGVEYRRAFDLPAVPTLTLRMEF